MDKTRELCKESHEKMISLHDLLMIYSGYGNVDSGIITRSH